MKTFDTRCGVTLAFLMMAAGGCGDPAAFDEEPIARSREAITITVGGTSMTHVENAINQAVSGDTVFFPAGTYELDSPDGGAPFLFKSGVVFVGDPAGTSVLKWSGSSVLTIKHLSAVQNATIANFTLQNVALRFEGTSSDFSAASNVYLRNLTFKGGKGDNWHGNGYLTMFNTDGFVVDGCTFLRSSGTEGGRGIRNHPAYNTIIKNSFIGTTKHLEMDAPHGHFRTAVNVGGSWEEGDDHALPMNQDIKIHNTVMRRVHNPTCTNCEDHGVYAAWYYGIELTRNKIDGWSPSSNGYSAKLRNSEDTFVFGNRFMRSGVYLHTDRDPSGRQQPEHLYDVHVRNNRFEMFGCTTGFCGISYARHQELGGTGYERNFLFTDNTFASGGPIHLKRVDGSQVCVENNTGATHDFEDVEGGAVQTSGCSPGDWNRPLAGVFTGDFNDDGVSDTATRVWNGQNRIWRVYLSNKKSSLVGDVAYQMLNFGDGVYVDVDTERYGVHVGDFTQDGKDDIAYRGKCGTAGDICWRVHASNGASFVTKLGFGDGMFHSDETARFGVHVGDFDGDGFKDDLVYRGKCGSPGVPCWRVHKSNGTTFTTHNFGDSAVWYEDESEIYGLFIGNFDGDAAGKDDIAYFGKCGSSRCIRVHLSTGSAFVHQSNWGQGDGVFRDGPEITEHFGMQVGDMPPADGKADIGYRGRCGSSSCWRYHKTNASGTGFDIVHSQTNVF